MKPTALFLLSGLLACSATSTGAADEPAKPAKFEIRLVVDRATPDSTEVTSTLNGRDEKLHIQKQSLFDGSAIKSAAAQKNATTHRPEILVSLTESAAKRLAQVTHDHLHRRLAIVIDGKVYMAPTIQSENRDGKVVISGIFTEQVASQIAGKLNDVAAGNAAK